MSYIKRVIKSVFSSSPLRRYIFPRWRYNFSAYDLCFLCKCLEDVHRVPGVVLEVGCEYGETTIFLNNFLQERSPGKKYVCVDTFDGFANWDIEYEVEVRGKERGVLLGFRNNSKTWFLRTLSEAGYQSVLVFQADAAKFDFRSVSPISFALVDVDLYKPIQACLPKLYKELSDGGIIIVDDCDSSDKNYDGAFYAYTEFMESMNLPIRIVGRKLGLIVKPSRAALYNGPI